MLGFRHLVLRPLSRDSVEAIAEQLLGKGDSSQSFLRQISESRYARLADRPLTLTYLCDVFTAKRGTLPDREDLLVHDVVEIYTKVWDEARAVSRETSSPNQLHLISSSDLLADIAFVAMVQGRGHLFSSSAVARQLARVHGCKANEAAEEIERLRTNSTLILDTGGGAEDYRFSHKIIAEHLAARGLFRSHARPSNKRPNPLALGSAIIQSPTLLIGALRLSRNHVKQTLFVQAVTAVSVADHSKLNQVYEVLTSEIRQQELRLEGSERNALALLLLISAMSRADEQMTLDLSGSALAWTELCSDVGVMRTHLHAVLARCSWEFDKNGISLTPPPQDLRSIGYFYDTSEGSRSRARAPLFLGRAEFAAIGWEPESSS